MELTTKKMPLALLGIGAVALVGGGVAAAQDTGTDPTTTTTAVESTDTTTPEGADADVQDSDGDTETKDCEDGRHGGPRGEQTEVTGDAYDQAVAAAAGAVEGLSVERVETGGHGGAAYHVHGTDADGERVVVLLDADYAVTDTEVDDGDRRGHRSDRDGDDSADVEASDTEAA